MIISSIYTNSMHFKDCPKISIWSSSVAFPNKLSLTEVKYQRILQTSKYFMLRYTNMLKCIIWYLTNTMEGSIPLSKCRDTIFHLSLSVVILVCSSLSFPFKWVYIFARLHSVNHVCEIYINEIVPLLQYVKKIYITKKTKV